MREAEEGFLPSHKSKENYVQYKSNEKCQRMEEGGSVTMTKASFLTWYWVRAQFAMCGSAVSGHLFTERNAILVKEQ